MKVILLFVPRSAAMCKLQLTRQQRTHNSRTILDLFEETIAEVKGTIPYQSI
ncbi:conserved hypothetical protein [Ricinus communis]|uniref:Uncharacterized protein n=1 Tax=Ricinus communis TaxID=3988 RepID=B9SFI0_RICCO|nr:conserved hypothetical protein [Ricinus communis]